MQPVSSRLQQSLLAVTLVLATLIGLYAFFPYFEGYATEKSSLLRWLWNAWHGYQGEWEHGMLVPWIALFLVAWNWPRLRTIEFRPSRWGLALTLLALFCFWFGYCADVEYFGWASLQLMLAGLVLWFAGIEMMRALFFPWAFFVFTFPMPFLDNVIAFPLRLFMTHASHFLLTLFGVPNEQVGTAIFSVADPAHGLAQGARFAIDVADPCSGIRSLFALLMLGALFAYFTLERTWQKWLLFLAVIPLAIAGNVARILILTFATLHWGGAIALGTAEQPSWIHEAAGYAVFFVALFGMIGCGLLLSWLGRYVTSAHDRSFASRASSHTPTFSFSLGRSAVLAALAALTVLLCLWTTPPNGLTQAGVNMTLPDYLGTWWGFQAPISEAEKTILPGDTEFARKIYESPQRDNVTCTIVLSGAEKRSIHRPEICLPGQGWTIQAGQVLSVPLHSGKNLQVMSLNITRPISNARGQKAQEPAYFIYWFVGDKVTTPYHWERLWLTSWDRIVHHINHRWAYVSVMSPITEGLQAHGKNSVDTLTMLKAFIADILPTFQKDGT